MPCLAVFSCLLASTSVCSAQDQAPADVRIFPATFFADAQLRTAFDLLGRVPGFTLDTGDKDVRGYSGSTGNVLIDGQRPASKYGQLADLLAQIPASAVERIELIRGASPDLDLQGQPVVANVIRRVELSAHASAEIGLYAHGDGRRLPEATIEGSRKSAGRFIEGSLSAYDVADDDSGSGYRQQVDPTGQLVRYANSDFVASTKGIAATLGYERAMSGGKLRITSAFLANRKGETEDITTTFPGRDFTEITEDKDTQQAELGAHFERVVGTSSRLEILAIQQLRTTDKVENEISESDIDRFSEHSDSGESILRTAVRTTLSASQSVEWGAEVAFNFLDSRTASLEDGVPVPLPAANVRVEEHRGEAFGLMSWAPRTTLNVEAGAAYEVSTITQNGDTKSSKSLAYLKPRALLTWTPSSVNQFRANLQRNVGQLDFDDFVSSAELSTGTVNVGNSDLEPYTSWDLIVSWERQFLSDSTAVITFHHARLSDVVDIVPIYADTDGDGVDEFYEGPGNIGNGTLSEIEVGLNIPLRQFNIVGGLLTGHVTYRRSSVKDPLTGEQRSIIDMKQPWEGDIEFTQDLPARRIRWGVSVILGTAEPEFRSDEVRSEREGAWIEAFTEFFPAADWTIRMDLQNLSSRENRLTRERYDAPRDSGQIEVVDVESREFASYVHLTVRWDFR